MVLSEWGSKLPHFVHMDIKTISSHDLPKLTQYNVRFTSFGMEVLLWNGWYLVVYET